MADTHNETKEFFINVRSQDYIDFLSYALRFIRVVEKRWGPDAVPENDKIFQSWIMSSNFKKKKLSSWDVFYAVANYFKISTEELMLNSRKDFLPAKRSIYFILAKRFTEDTYSQIGFIAGGKDHCTVLYHVKKYWNIVNSPTMDEKHKKNILFKKNIALDEINIILAKDFRNVDIIKFYQIS